MSPSKSPERREDERPQRRPRSLLTLTLLLGLAALLILLYSEGTGPSNELSWNEFMTSLSDQG